MTRYLAGVDLSRYNGEPVTAGLAFGFARATYGCNRDDRYARHMATFRDARMVAGAYHFGVGAKQDPISAQVDTFLNVAGSADLLALDLERNGTAPSMTRAEAIGFILRVHATGRTIGLYHSRSGFPRIGQDWNWVAQYGLPDAAAGDGTVRPRGITWSFWQWQGAPLDRDWYSGSAADLAELTARTHHRRFTP